MAAFSPFDFLHIYYPLTATKTNNSATGPAVHIRGWSSVLAQAKTVIFTVTDEQENTCWTRMIQSSQCSEPLAVSVSPSALGHRISVTAEFMTESPAFTKPTVQHFQVVCETSCVASEETYDALSDGLRKLSLAGAVASSPNVLCTIQPTVSQGDNFNKACLTIPPPPCHVPVTHWIISVKRNDCSRSKQLFVVSDPGRRRQMEFDFPIDFRSGGDYKILVQGLYAPNMNYRVDGNYTINVTGSTEFKSYLTVQDMRRLYSMAVDRNKYLGSSRCLYFYRNKPPTYFEEIFEQHGGIMKVYKKDKSGDQGCPISNRIDGLFFMASVQYGSTTGEPMSYSAFGGTRLVVEVKELLDRAPKVYFADYYCMRSYRHFVTLVLTRSGSDADALCARHLMPVSLHRSSESENPFLFYDDQGELNVVNSTNDTFVEILFTEDLDINRYRYELKHNTPLVGKGTSTPGGLPKNTNCTRCNLEPRAFGSLNPMNPF